MERAAEDAGVELQADDEMFVGPEAIPWGGRVVYFVQGGAEGLVKIGRTTLLRSRLSSLRTMSPVPLQLLGWVDDDRDLFEHKLHWLLREHRAHGEWFRPHPALLHIIDFAKSATCEDFGEFLQEMLDGEAEERVETELDRRCLAGEIADSERYAKEALLSVPPPPYRKRSLRGVREALCPSHPSSESVGVANG